MRLKRCFSPISYWFIRTIAQVLKSGINLTFTVAIVTENGHQNRLKIGKLPFWNEFETFDTEINIEHKQLPKVILTDDKNYHGTQVIKVFWHLAVLISNS